MGIPKHVRRVIKIVVRLALFAVVSIAALLGVLWLDHTRETTLPTPTGPFAVGRTTYVWSDAAHADPMAPQPDTNRGTKRDLLAWIWYPAAPQRLSQTIDDYLPAPWRMALQRQTGPVITQFVTRDLSRVHAHSIRNAEVSPEQRSYPVVFMRPGAARLNASDPSGRFLGRLNLQRVGVFAHSLGGATALQFCHDDPRCKAGIDVDGLPLGMSSAKASLSPSCFS